MGTSLGGLQPISSGLTARYDTIYDDTDALNVDAVSYSYAMEYKVDWPSNRVLRSDTLGSILFYDRDAELSQSTLVNPNLFWTPYMGWPNPTYVLNQSLDGLPYNWTPVDTTQDTTLLYSRPTAAGDYVLKITTTNGIYTSESNFLKFGVVPPPIIPPVVIRPVIIPNVFTPNADGINDVFRITNIEDYGASKLTIVNRWGVSVYESDNYQNAWDGGDAIPGEYFYIIELGSGGGLFSGQVKLIR
jgi:gliding motility-associated-like protein